MKQNGETTLADVVASIKELGDQLDARIDQLDKNVNRRFDSVLKMLGGHHRDHERRIAALEKSLAAIKKAG